MRSNRSRILVVITLAALLLVVFASIAVAQPPANDGLGKAFGQHHAACAQMHGGFSADMNPGMHRGLAGWTQECQEHCDHE